MSILLKIIIFFIGQYVWLWGQRPNQFLSNTYQIDNIPIIYLMKYQVIEYRMCNICV